MTVAAGRAGAAGMFTPPIAHTGHLLISLPVFLGPVLAILVWISIVRYRDRRG